jgi:DNA-binding MarR family transcriptional regulator
MCASKTAPPDKNSWRDAVPDDRLAHLIKDARRAMERALQMRLIEHSVSFGHWSFLRILWEHDGLTQRTLSELAGVMAPTTFSAVNAMEALGYVERRQKAGNKKNTYIHLTRKGRSLKSKLVPLAEEVNAIGIRGLEAEDVRTARKVLLKIIANLVEDETELLAANRRVPSTRELGRMIAS